jgi:hypothetical protein
MPKFVVEREVPGIGGRSREELRAIAQKSNGVLDRLGPKIQWMESYVTDDKLYCVYMAPSADLIRRHAQEGGFPANRISEIRGTMDPTTGD